MKDQKLKALPQAEAMQPKLKRETTKSPAFFSAYANDIQVQTGPWDVRLILGELVESSSSALIVNLLGELRISPQLAKKLTTIMMEQLNAYEERFGVIPSPKD